MSRRWTMGVWIAVGLAQLPGLLACLPPPTTYGLRASGDAADADELRLTAAAGVVTDVDPEPSSPMPLVAADAEVGLTEHLSARGRIGALQETMAVEAELLADTELQGPWLLGARLGVGWMPAVSASYVRPHLGVMGGYRQGPMQVYLGTTVNPTFEGATWLQGHAGAIYEPVSRRGLRGGIELMGGAPVEDPQLFLAPQVFVGAAL